MFFLIFLIIILVFGDQMLKFWIITHLGLNEDLSFLPGFMDLTYVRNTGAAWSLFSNKLDFLVIISILAIVYFCYLLYKHRHQPLLQRIIYCLIIGGALGNLIDRLRYGYVIDMFKLKIFSFPIFNIADTAICVGILLLIINVLRYGEEEVL